MYDVIEYREIENPSDSLKDAIHSAFCFNLKIRAGEMYYREFCSNGGDRWEMLYRADLYEAFKEIKPRHGNWPWIYE